MLSSYHQRLSASRVLAVLLITAVCATLTLALILALGAPARAAGTVTDLDAQHNSAPLASDPDGGST